MMTLNYVNTVSYGVPLWKTILEMTTIDRCDVEHIYDVVAGSPRFDFLVKTLELDKTAFELPENKIKFISSFTHNSFINEISDLNLQSYERAEFLGDSILQFILSDSLVEKYPELNEGQLSKLRSSLVNEDVLAQVSDSLGLIELLLAGKGHQEHQFEKSDAIKADLFESFLGALFKIYGLDQTKAIFQRVIAFYEEKYEVKFYDLSRLQLFDPKSSLQELVLKETKELPLYKVQTIENEKQAFFKCEVYENEILLGKGEGSSKKVAQKEAAKDALTNKKSKYYIK